MFSFEGTMKICLFIGNDATGVSRGKSFACAVIALMVSLSIFSSDGIEETISAICCPTESRCIIDCVMSGLAVSGSSIAGMPVSTIETERAWFTRVLYLMDAASMPSLRASS